MYFSTYNFYDIAFLVTRSYGESGDVGCVVVLVSEPGELITIWLSHVSVLCLAVSSVPQESHSDRLGGVQVVFPLSQFPS